MFYIQQRFDNKLWEVVYLYSGSHAHGYMDRKTAQQAADWRNICLLNLDMNVWNNTDTDKP